MGGNLCLTCFCTLHFDSIFLIMLRCVLIYEWLFTRMFLCCCIFIFIFVWMSDECTWHHKTFLVQLYWHLAIKLHCTLCITYNLFYRNTTHIIFWHSYLIFAVASIKYMDLLILFCKAKIICRHKRPCICVFSTIDTAALILILPGIQPHST